MFYKYVAPLPQRKFRDNRLGLILTANQNRSEEIPCNKYESDRGIYTIKLNSKHTAPIKLKRRSSTNTTVRFFFLFDLIMNSCSFSSSRMIQMYFQNVRNPMPTIRDIQLCCVLCRF